MNGEKHEKIGFEAFFFRHAQRAKNLILSVLPLVCVTSEFMRFPHISAERFRFLIFYSIWQILFCLFTFFVRFGGKNYIKIVI
jgi:hypothetical protein